MLQLKVIVVIRAIITMRILENTNVLNLIKKGSSAQQSSDSNYAMKMMEMFSEV